jgi:hypothetical protein
MVNSDLMNLYGWVQDIYHWLDISFKQIQNLQNKTSSFNSTADIVATMRQDVISNGIFLGSDWWMGQQGNNLYAIDVNSPSFYTFQAGVNYTMGGNSTSA